MLWHASPGRRATILYTQLGPQPGEEKKSLRHKNEKEKSSGAIRARGRSEEAEAWIEAAYDKSKKEITLRPGDLNTRSI
jgi:hypothetical protein